MSFLDSSNFPLFANVDESLFTQLINNHSIIVFPSHTELIKKNQQNKQMFMLIEGVVEVYDDLNKKPLRELSACSVFGEISVLDSKLATASVVTKTQCKTLILDEQEIWQLCEKSHAFTNNILKQLVESTRRVSNQLDSSVENLKEIQQQARLDVLTGLFNRRWLDENLPTIIGKCQTKQLPLSFLMLDIDSFKAVNDTYGHDAGDAVLKQVGTIVQTYARSRDAAVRYGGEEICLILVNTGLAESKVVAERLREAFEKTEFRYTSGKSLFITVSIGLTMLADDDNLASLMKRADNALYQAKNAGRNRVIEG